MWLALCAREQTRPRPTRAPQTQFAPPRCACAQRPAAVEPIAASGPARPYTFTARSSGIHRTRETERDKESLRRCCDGLACMPQHAWSSSSWHPSGWGRATVRPVWVQSAVAQSSRRASHTSAAACSGTSLASPCSLASSASWRDSAPWRMAAAISCRLACCRWLGGPTEPPAQRAWSPASGTTAPPPPSQSCAPLPLPAQCGCSFGRGARPLLGRTRNASGSLGRVPGIYLAPPHCAGSSSSHTIRNGRPGVQPAAWWRGSGVACCDARACACEVGRRWLLAAGASALAGGRGRTQRPCRLRLRERSREPHRSPHSASALSCAPRAGVDCAYLFLACRCYFCCGRCARR